SITQRLARPCHIVAYFRAALPPRSVVCIRAALPPRSAVRLCLTGARVSLKFLGVSASNSCHPLFWRRIRIAIAASIVTFSLFQFSQMQAFAQKRRIPPGGHLAVVVDERLAALRSAPDASG